MKFLSLAAFGSFFSVASGLGLGLNHLQNRKHGHLMMTSDGDLNADPCEGEAVVDNFANPLNIEHWARPQRYWLNREFWQGPGSPIFVYIGGEGEESCRRLKGNQLMRVFAKDYGALMVDIEHRFYGESYPTETMSTNNFRYLSADQALADLARLVGKIQSDLSTESSKVISFGGSYPGNLSAWFRLKYPNVVHGAIASSAPVTASVNFPEYMDVVANAILYFSGEECYDAFEKAADEFAMYAADKANGWAKLEKDFHTCAPMQNEKDVAILMSDMMGNIQGTVQYNKEQANVANVTDICKVMLDNVNPVDGYTPYNQFVKLSQNYLVAGGKQCEDASWDHTIQHLSNITFNPDNNMRPWTFQTCSEFGYYQTTDSTNQPFHSWKLLGLDFFRDTCAASFDGWNKDPDVYWTNQKYGALNIQGTNIAFTGGTIDPWHARGITNNTKLVDNSEYPIYMLGTAHCRDLTGPLPDDSESIQWAHNNQRLRVEEWLGLKSENKQNNIVMFE